MTDAIVHASACVLSTLILAFGLVAIALRDRRGE